jgi:catechol 2,3-dioxygenase-like lactoylglutathione lyase family enzyme
MTIPPRISIVTLGVADLAASTAFYESLGWSKSGSSEGTITFFQMQGSVLGLYEHHALADDAQVPAGPFVDGVSGFRGVTLALNLASVDEVDAVFAEWVAAGAAATVEPHTASWGGHSSYVADPDGHLWELACNPYAQFDGAGNLVLAPPAD